MATMVPLPWFAIIGSFIEEVIAPIPSALVMTVAGTLAATSAKAWWYIIFLAIIGSVSKTVGSWLVYVLSDKAEDVLIRKIGWIFGLSHQNVENAGKYFNKGLRDDVVLFLLRAIPFMPTAPVSIGSGIIKINIRTFLVSTFFGNIVRNLFYLYVGYTGVNILL